VAGEKAGVTVSGLATATGDATFAFTSVMEHVAQGFEALGAAILVVGAVWSLVLAVMVWRHAGNARPGYQAMRRAFGATLLLGLEVLVAADLIRTVAVAPTVSRRPVAPPPAYLSPANRSVSGTNAPVVSDTRTKVS
jgi:uncharacterized membrane protein